MLVDEFNWFRLRISSFAQTIRRKVELVLRSAFNNEIMYARTFSRFKIICIFDRFLKLFVRHIFGHPVWVRLFEADEVLGQPLHQVAWHRLETR